MADDESPPLAFLRGSTVVYELEDAETQIGRNDDNDIVSVAANALALNCIEGLVPATERSPHYCLPSCDGAPADSQGLEICVGRACSNRYRLSRRCETC